MIYSFCIMLYIVQSLLYFLDVPQFPLDIDSKSDDHHLRSRSLKSLSSLSMPGSLA